MIEYDSLFPSFHDIAEGVLSKVEVGGEAQSELGRYRGVWVCLADCL